MRERGSCSKMGSYKAVRIVGVEIAVVIFESCCPMRVEGCWEGGRGVSLLGGWIFR